MRTIAAVWHHSVKDKDHTRQIKTRHVTSMNQSTTLMTVLTLLAFGLRPSLCWCETRCEQSIPSLYRLRAYWSRSFKRIGEQRVSFEQFLLSLVQQSDDEVVKQLRSSLLRIIGRYQDCVMACEHQFSKRNQRGRGRSRKLKQLSKVTTILRQRSTLEKDDNTDILLSFQSARLVTHLT
ncbi:unnamed protein product [Candidula unifasciata]|uniref:Uncharacterized protein n=1 Tax=Candidula unifasciata TaxID=100452 RepID=A0A8S3YEP0_9EUPU|nr:unnamed protein product [Candidula unifasciata]